MFLLVGFAILVGFLVIMLTIRARPSSSVAPERAALAQTLLPDHLDSLTLAQFEDLCVRLLEEFGLVINARARRGDRELEISAVNPQPVTGGDFLVHCRLAGEEDLVDSASLIALSDHVRAEGATKGIYITTGYFSEESTKLSYEGPTLELINRPRLLQMVEEYELFPAAL